MIKIAKLTIKGNCNLRPPVLRVITVLPEFDRPSNNLTRIAVPGVAGLAEPHTIEMQMPSHAGPPPEKMLFQLSLRRRGISDQAVLRAMEAVPRDRFVEPPDRDRAWRDAALPIACGQTISQPFVVAYMTEQLKLSPRLRVLEIGTGSGYQTAILARLCRDVVSVERFKTLADRARAKLAELGCGNVEVMVGDGLALPEGMGTFDRILVSAALPALPQPLLELLDPDGLLIAPVGPAHAVQTLVRVRRVADDYERKALLDVRFVPAIRGIAREL